MDRSGWRKPPKAEMPRKTLWRGEPVHVYSFYCPLCAANRRVPFRSRPGGFRQVSQIAITAAFITLLTWQWFDWKGIVSFVPLWTAFELVYRSRMRASLRCHGCGFDPFLCLVDEEKAKAEVEAHWREKFAQKGLSYPDGAKVAQAPPVDAPSDPAS